MARKTRHPGYKGVLMLHCAPEPAGMPTLQDAFGHCEAEVRAGDRDRFLAALFAPAQHRAGLFALYAFNLAIARVREAVHNPLAGEIRLQWWSDVLDGQARGSADASPVAAALLAAIAQYGLDISRLQDLIVARRFDLYDEPMSTLADFEAYANRAAANLISLAAQLLVGKPVPEIDALAHHAGTAQAIAGLLAAFPIHSRRGQLYVPLELLQRHGSGREDVSNNRATPALRAGLAELRSIARGHLRQARELPASAPAQAIPAFLPVALAGPVLARMQRVDYDPFVPVALAPWRRQWLMWRAAQAPDRMFR
jgi:phytoene synthase